MRHVEVTPTDCWHWTGATSVPRNQQRNYPRRYKLADGTTVTSQLTKTKIMTPVVKHNGRVTSPARILKQVPDGVRMTRRSCCSDPVCVNPDHWTYPGDVTPPPPTGDPILDQALERFRDGWTLEDLAGLYSPEIIDLVKEHGAE